MKDAFDELQQLQCKFDSMREKYIRFYLSLLAQCRDYKRQETLLRWVVLSNKHHSLMWHWAGLLIRDLNESLRAALDNCSNSTLSIKDTRRLILESGKWLNIYSIHQL